MGAQGGAPSRAVAICLGGATLPDGHRGQGNEPSPNGTLPLGLFPMPGAGFEPACLTAVDFKSTVFTSFTTRADARLSPLLPRRPQPPDPGGHVLSPAEDRRSRHQHRRTGGDHPWRRPLVYPAIDL